MATDKALLSLAGTTLLDRSLATLSTVCSDVTLVGRSCPGVRSIPDAAQQIGPVGGVTAALRDLLARQLTWALFLPLDVPLLPHGLLRALVNHWLASPAVRVAFPIADGHPQPVICLIHVSALPAFEHALETSQHRLRAVLEGAASAQALARTRLELQASPILADGHPLPWRPTALDRQLQHLWFSNCNTPADFADLQQALAQTHPA